MDDPEKDRGRKSKFWSQLEDIVLSRSNQSHLLILGDFNARLDPLIDPEQDHIGPHVVGVRVTNISIVHVPLLEPNVYICFTPLR